MLPVSQLWDMQLLAVAMPVLLGKNYSMMNCLTKFQSGDWAFKLMIPLHLRLELLRLRQT